jgi:chromosome segregation ATPase
MKDAMLADKDATIRALRRELAGAKEEGAAEAAGAREAAAELRARLEEVSERVDGALGAREEALSEAARERAAAAGARRVAEQLNAVCATLREQAGEAEAMRRALAAKEAALAFVDREVAGLREAFEARVAAACADRAAALAAAAEAGERAAGAAAGAEGARAEAARANAEAARLGRALEEREGALAGARARVVAVEAEMRVLLGELDAGRGRQAELVRRLGVVLSDAGLPAALLVGGGEGGAERGGAGAGGARSAHSTPTRGWAANR